MPAAAWLALLAGVVIAVAALLISDPYLGMVVPVAAVAAVVCARTPAASVGCLFVLTGASNSLTAFTPLPVRGLTGLILLALWLGILWRYLIGRQRRLWMWPGIIAIALYVILTALELFTAQPLSTGFMSFRLAVWPMTAVLLIALAGWPAERLARIARWAIAIAVLVGAYNVFRWVVGAAPQELTVARQALPGVPLSQGMRFFGSFPTAQDLANWTATMIPFALALALGWRGRWRVVAAVAIGLCSLALVATNVLTGVFAVVVGTSLALVLFALSRAFPGGRRLTAGVVTTLVLVVAGAGIYTVAVNPAGKFGSRFSHLLSPTSDPTYQTRQQRWSEALADISKHPFGHGLGTAGAAAHQRAEVDPTSTPNFDSSYLKIAFEQGMSVMLFFVCGLLLLLVGMARRAVLVTDPARATLAIGGCGSLAALIVMFYAGFYIEQVETLSGWILVGIGAAQFTAPRRRDDAVGSSSIAAREAGADRGQA